MRKILKVTSLTLVLAVLSSCNIFLGDSVNGEIDSREINYNMGIVDMPHGGKPKLLVIPVDFSDSPHSRLSSGNLLYSETESIEKVFFGTTEETGWESVSSYYTKSSYGKLNIEGTVTPWYRAKQTTREYTSLALSNQSPKPVTDLIAEEALEWVKTTYTDIDIDDYDTDGDGLIDSVWFVYSRAYETSSPSGLWWAYTTWLNTDNTSNTTEIGAYSWASYSFIYDESNYIMPDAHTFIHETGHLLGLDDYYDASSTPNYVRKWPIGGLDMMDYNIGDHNAFSKYLLDWIEPTVITEESKTYTLEPFESSGDSLIIPISYKDNPYGEYIILEYYTPTGLNELDSKQAYSNNLKMFTESGVLMYHVDNRLGRFNYSPGSGYTWNGTYYEEISTYRTNLYLYVPINSNTPEYCYDDASQKLIGLIGANDHSFRQAESRTQAVSNEALYQLGDTFIGSQYSTNSSKKINYDFTISELTDEGVTISITYNV